MRAIQSRLWWTIVAGAVLALSASGSASVEQDPVPIDPLLSSPSWVGEGGTADRSYGFSVASAGDLNGDGYADVVVGVPYTLERPPNEFEDVGKVYVYYGSASGPSANPDWVKEPGQLWWYHSFGYSVASADDVNGDGYDDLIVGAHDWGSPIHPRAYVFHGSAMGLLADPNWTGLDGIDQLRVTSVGSAGDINGDGYADVIVGAVYGEGEGQAFLFHGSPAGLSSTPDWQIQDQNPPSLLGWSVASAGDVNADGYDDVVVGAPFNQLDVEPGEVFVYHGSPSGLGASPDWTAQGEQQSERFGFSVDTAGDVNGDGYDDVVIGAPEYRRGNREGRVLLYYGSPSGPSTSADWTVEGVRDSRFGFSVRTARDINVDGAADIIVGAAGEERAYVYLGSGSGPSTGPDWTAQGELPDSWFGRSVASAGDVNGDGAPDVIVGDSGAQRAYVYLAAHPGNRPPEANAGPDRLIAATSPGEASVYLDGSGSSDPDASSGTHDDIVLFEWFENFGLPSETLLGTGESLHVTLPLGVHTITLRATDRAGAQDMDEAEVSVVETLPPGLSLGATPQMLWPPNHRLVDVGISMRVGADCPTPSAWLASVTSNEPDNAPGAGDGNTIDDIRDAQPGTQDFDLVLRAERSGNGAGRNYAITYSVSCNVVDESTFVVLVSVPQYRNGVTDPIETHLETNDSGTRVRWSYVPEAEYYNVIRGRLENVAETDSVITLGAVVCIESHSLDEDTEGLEDTELPSAGEAFFYLVEFVDGERSTYGSESASKPRLAGQGDCE
jgi:hypothetical protein